MQFICHFIKYETIKYSAKEKELLFWVTTPLGDINKVIRGGPYLHVKARTLDRLQLQFQTYLNLRIVLHQRL